MSGIGRSGLGPASGDIIRSVPNGAANSSGPSVGASSLVTDANSTLSGGPQLQRSASINTESYMRLPASPMSFSSNNISGSSVMDGSSIVQQSPHQDPVQKQGASSATSQPTVQEQGNPLHAQKRPRFDVRQEDVLQQQVIQQLLQRQESLQLQGHQNPQLQAIIHQQRLAQRQQQQQQQQQQHQMLQSFPQMQRTQIQQQQQLRHNMQQLAMQPAPPVKRPFDSGICARRLMQYMYHQRHRPPDNSILYWRKFVLEYFAPRAKKRWCLSMYDNVGNHAFGVFPQTAMDAWQCDICGSKSGKGFEATFEVLPRLCQIKFDRGVIDELLFLDMPHECRLSNGIMVLEYAKAVQESVYEQLHVVREGQLRIIFTPELKILSWEFCARRHEEFFSRRLVAPQVSQLLQVAQKYQTAVNESGSAGVPQQDLQASCNMFVSAGRQLAKNLDLQSLNDLGFSKRYVRCLQIAEVVNSMKDLIDFSQEHKIGPIESLKNYPRQAAAKLQNHKLQEEQLMAAQNLPADQSTLNKIMAIHPGMSSQMNNNFTGSRVLNNTAQGAVALNNYQSLLRNSVSPNHNAIHPDASCTFSGPNQAQSMHYQGSAASILSNPTVNGLSNSNQQHPQMNGSIPQQNNLQSSQVNQHLQQQVIHQMLQEVMNNRGTPQQSLSTPAANGNMATGDVFHGASSAGGMAARMNTGSFRNGLGIGNIMTNKTMSRSNSLKSVSNNPTVSGSSLNSKADLAQNMHMPELDHDIAQEFAESGLFGSEADDMGYGWKV